MLSKVHSDKYIINSLREDKILKYFDAPKVSHLSFTHKHNYN